MFLVGRRQAADGAAKQSALDELLSTEQEIALQQAAADREAAALTAAARNDAEEITRTAAAALASELAALDKRDEATRAELVRSLEAGGARLVSKYESLGADEIARMAAFVVKEVTGLTPESAR